MYKGEMLEGTTINFTRSGRGWYRRYLGKPRYICPAHVPADQVEDQWIRVKKKIDEASPAQATNKAIGTLFPVHVVKDGGADGTTYRPATWTYSVYEHPAGALLGSGVPVARPRPNGRMAFQEYDGTHACPGIAYFVSGSSLMLWDAGEIPATGQGYAPRRKGPEPPLHPLVRC